MVKSCSSFIFNPTANTSATSSAMNPNIKVGSENANILEYSHPLSSKTCALVFLLFLVFISFVKLLSIPICTQVMVQGMKEKLRQYMIQAVPLQGELNRGCCVLPVSDSDIKIVTQSCPFRNTLEFIAVTGLLVGC